MSIERSWPSDDSLMRALGLTKGQRPQKGQKAKNVFGSGPVHTKIYVSFFRPEKEMELKVA